METSKERVIAMPRNFHWAHHHNRYRTSPLFVWDINRFLVLVQFGEWMIYDTLRWRLLLVLPLCTDHTYRNTGIWTAWLFLVFVNRIRNKSLNSLTEPQSCFVVFFFVDIRNSSKKRRIGTATLTLKCWRLIESSIHVRQLKNHIPKKPNSHHSQCCELKLKKAIWVIAILEF